jgi:hypothetical protein
MPRHRLIIEAGEGGPLLLQIDAGTLTLRGSQKHPEAMLQSLRVARLHCELEVEEEPVAIRGSGHGARRPLHPGEVLQAGDYQLRMEAESEPAAPLSGEEDDLIANIGTAEEPAPQVSAPEDSSSEEGGALPKCLVVIDGCDQGTSFRLPLSGTLTLGKSRKHSDVVLHDLYVGRLHCQFEVNGDEVVVVDMGGTGGTMVNGEKIARQTMKVGEVVRVGNSHLRLELAIGGAKKEAAAESSVATPEEAGEEEEVGFEVVEEEETGGEEVVELPEADEEEAPPEDMPAAARQLQQLRDELERLVGQVLGHYRIAAILGRGRYGVVFRADDLKTGQPVALKVLSPLFPQTDAELGHFAQVLRSTLPLRHANLVRLHGMGKTGMYTWMVRDYVEGESVADLLRRLPAGRRLDWRIAYRVAVHVARALEFARSNHLHHGQVTPANILLRRGSSAALLADLMLTSALEGSRLTQAALGYRPSSELCFLSPEQAQTEELVDPMADQYTLGATVYALLTGRPPFLGDTANEVLEQVLGPTRAARPGVFHAATPPALEKIVLRMLAKKPEDRYPSSAALLVDLKHFAEAEAVEV